MFSGRGISVDTTIDRPVDEVWARLTDWPRAAEWMPGVESVRADCETSGVWKLAGGMIRIAIRRADSGQLESFKRVVEAASRDA